MDNLNTKIPLVIAGGCALALSYLAIKSLTSKSAEGTTPEVKPEEKVEPESTEPKQRYVVMMRHGERADRMSESQALETQEDCRLTEHGLLQAETTGEFL